MTTFPSFPRPHSAPSAVAPVSRRPAWRDFPVSSARPADLLRRAGRGEPSQARPASPRSGSAGAGVGHFADDLANEGLARLQQLIQSDRSVHHSLKTAFVFGRDIEPCRCKDLRHRAMVAQKIDDERLPQSVVYSFMGEQVTYVE